MLTYCLKCRETTKSKDPKFARVKNRKIMLLSKCAMCNIKKRNLSNSKKLADY